MTDSRRITESVKDKYAAIAESRQASCCDSTTDSCGPSTDVSTGYTKEELASLPKGADLGLGCGNPTALAGLRPGETVIDLGSGAGIDCFLAVKKVGPDGYVIGIDMTEAMVTKARRNASEEGLDNVEFRLGRIEEMPVSSATADVVISNCVINLAPDKQDVFREIFRVLKPGGRFVVSDIVSKGHIPGEERENMECWAGCVAGALDIGDYLEVVRRAGFTALRILAEVDYDFGKTATYSLASLTLEATRPAQ